MHKPGAIPLRPLGLGDIFDAAFKIIRFNPQATAGAAVLVAAVAMSIPVLITGIVSLTVDFDAASGLLTYDDVAAALLSGGSLLVGAMLSSIGLMLVTGMIAQVCVAAAVGRRLSLGQAWAATRGSRWRLVGLTLLLGTVSVLLIGAYVGAWVAVVMLTKPVVIVIWGLITLPLFGVFMVWFWIRFFYLPAPALMIERLGVFAAIARGYSLSRGHFWRTLGIALLTYLLAQIAGTLLAMPISVVLTVSGLSTGTTDSAYFFLILGQALSTVVAAAFVTPFTGCVTSLQYLDLRIRKEAFDVDLMTQAGITAP